MQEGSDAEPVAVAAALLRVLSPDAVNASIYSPQRMKTPVSDHLLDLIGPVASSIVADQQRLENLVDEVEFLMGVAYMAGGFDYGPHGRAALAILRL